MGKDARKGRKRFREFRAEGRRCIIRWGLSDWDVDFMHTALEKSVTAHCAAVPVHHRASLVLNKATSHELSRAEAIDAARHEVVHVLVAPLQHTSIERYVTEDEVERAVESVVNRLNKALR